MFGPSRWVCAWSWLTGPCVVPQVLRPDYYVRSLQLWRAVYLSETVPSAMPDDNLSAQHSSESTLVGSGDDLQTSRLSKTRSCDDLAIAPEPHAGLGRRLSDPNVATDPSLLLLGAASTPQSPIDTQGGVTDAWEEDLQGGGLCNGDARGHTGEGGPAGGAAVQLVHRTGLLAHGSTDTLTDEPRPGGAHPGAEPGAPAAFQQCCDFSTSTSDISDSHATHGSSRLDDALVSLTVGSSRPLTLTADACGSSTGSVESGDSDPPYSSSTPNSTNPPTPADVRVSTPPLTTPQVLNRELTTMLAINTVLIILLTFFINAHIHCPYYLTK